MLGKKDEVELHASQMFALELLRMMLNAHFKNGVQMIHCRVHFSTVWTRKAEINPFSYTFLEKETKEEETRERFVEITAIISSLGEHPDPYGVRALCRLFSIAKYESHVFWRPHFLSFVSFYPNGGKAREDRWVFENGMIDADKVLKNVFDSRSDIFLSQPLCNDDFKKLSKLLRVKE